jgi:phosphohistidine phosphatase
VLLVGHNPAAQVLILKLAIPTEDHGADTEPESPLEAIGRKFPTGALATLEFDGPWSRLTAASARLTAYVRPNALA